MNKYVYWGYVSRDTSPIFVHGVRDFLFCLDLELLKKRIRQNQVFLIFAITEDLSKRKKISNTPL